MGSGNSKKENNSHIAGANSKLTEFSVGDYVLVDYPVSNHHKGPPNKLLTNRRGPMKIVYRKGDHYALLDLASNKQTEPRHIKYLHPFHYDKELVDPRTVANADKEFYDVDKILQHKGSKRTPSKMTFEVLWKPVDDNPAETTWEPWSNVKTTIALHQYLAANNMNEIIPIQYQKDSDKN